MPSIIPSKILVLALLIMFVQCEVQKVAMVDAGSSGSRLFIFFVEDSGAITEKCSVEDKDMPFKANKLGTLIDDYFKQSTAAATLLNPEKFTENLLSMLRKCAEKLDSNEQGEAFLRNNTLDSFMILSTAGSRDAINTAAKDTNEIFKKVEEQIKEQMRSYLKSGVNPKVSVVTGRYEGIYGYLAFYNKVKVASGNWYDTFCSGYSDLLSCLKDITYFEVGGSSSQVAFLAPNESKRFAKKVFKKGVVTLPQGLSSELNGLKLYSRSFLGNGLNQLFASVIRQETSEPGDCYSQGSSSEKEDRYTGCLDQLNKIQNDNTLLKQPYNEQWQEIRQFMGDRKIFALNFKAAFCAYDSSLSGPDQNDPHKKCKGPVRYLALNDIEAYKTQFQPLVPQSDFYGAKQIESDTIHPGLAIPAVEYFHNNLFTSTKPKIVLFDNSWTEGALLLNKKSSKATENFVKTNTNQFENEPLDLSQSKKIKKSKKLSHSNKVKKHLRRSKRH